jgi:hypothetical protein
MDRPSTNYKFYTDRYCILMETCKRSCMSYIRQTLHRDEDQSLRSITDIAYKVSRCGSRITGMVEQEGVAPR